jgi:hypothetical protein
MKHAHHISLLVALGLLVLLAACVMPGDLREVADTIDDLNAQKIDQTEAAARIDAVAALVEKRTEAWADHAKDIPTDPAALFAYLISIGGTIAGSVVATNRVRDKRRRLRNEPVDPPMYANGDPPIQPS